MAKFTLIDDSTEVSAVTMHLADPTEKGAVARKRLHLVGVAEKDGKSLKLESNHGDVADSGKPVLYKDSAGIWSIDLHAKKKGNADIQAKVGGTVVAKVSVAVLDRLELPADSTDEGLLVRLFIAETASPETRTVSWTAENAKKSMQWMSRVLQNRLDNNPQQFMAKGAKTIRDIVTAKDQGSVQYEGFSKYPNIDNDIDKRIQDAFKRANDDNDKKQADYAAFVQAALDVANSNTLIADPCGADNFLSGWMTLGHTTGDDQVKFQTIMDNQFFMLKRKK